MPLKSIVTGGGQVRTYGSDGNRTNPTQTVTKSVGYVASGTDSNQILSISN